MSDLFDDWLHRSASSCRPEVGVRIAKIVCLSGKHEMVHVSETYAFLILWYLLI